MKKEDIPSDIADAMRKIMDWAIWEPDEYVPYEHTADTPRRFVHALWEMTHRDPEDIKLTTFPTTSDEMVIVDNIPFTSLCAHHLLPFTGVCHIGYVPAGQIIGLSKFARMVRYFSHRPSVQEELTSEIANFIYDQLDPKGLGVIMQAQHSCMSIRGVRSVGSSTTTNCFKGVFLDPTKGARQEFLDTIHRRR